MPDGLISLIGFFSDFGDENILWPVMALTGLLLIVQARRKIFFQWLALVIVVFGGMLVLKLEFEACGRLPGQNLYSPSGHTAGTTFVYGSMIVLFGRLSIAGFMGALAIALLAGAARVWLHVHSVAEVCVGGALGMVGVLLLTFARYREIQTSSKQKQPDWSVVVLLVGVLIVALSLHGLRSPAEVWLEYFSHRFVAPFRHCPVTLSTT
ncbi:MULTISPECIES: phosphatase PAP2 family protein [Gluconobacter]|uniref:Phosphatase PAP2 family protein n=1 Tax=Gluconobacter cadivus TaxID=2728101 RepID=A0ABR9YVY1_9PROT|nr:MULTISPECIES: phosphatase PAP2 family protein [Gluconobacter]MBF0888692.1 phosphatase PAP2 family protein [Gluconobacter cadivus]MBS1059969.1 phosphatase PAP2 family protein [Gluconobacter sp. Dm-44]